MSDTMFMNYEVMLPYPFWRPIFQDRNWINMQKPSIMYFLTYMMAKKEKKKIN